MTVREQLHHIVFGTETKSGKQFDVFLLWVILISVLAVMLESVPEIGITFVDEFVIIEWILTVIFTLEYLLRLWISPKPIKYIFSFWGIIDLLSILPTYISFFITGYHYLLIIRIFRLLRVFRILKLVRFTSEARVLLLALRASSYKIGIFMMAVMAIVIFLGTIMYVVEGADNGFTSIPQSIYWAIVTITTVGYGDIAPHTVLGKSISSIAMIMGYAIIAVPTGIVTVAFSKSNNKQIQCPECNKMSDEVSNYCSECGNKLKT